MLSCFEVKLPEPLGPKLFILGEPVLHRYYTVYDWEQKKAASVVIAAYIEVLRRETGLKLCCAKRSTHVLTQKDGISLHFTARRGSRERPGGV